MAKPPAPPVESRWVKLIPITVAAIGALAVLASALVSNWDKIFPVSHPGPVTPPVVSTAGAQSPVVSGAGRDVTINIGRQEGSGPRMTPPQRGAIDGQWETDVFVNGGYQNRLFLRLKVFPNGQVTGMVQYVDANDGRRFGPEFGIVDGQVDGSFIAVSFFGGGKSQPDWKPIKEWLRAEAEGDVMKGQYQYSDMAPVETVIRRVEAAPPLYGR